MPLSLAANMEKYDSLGIARVHAFSREFPLGKNMN
jgi:hypothetical protein